MERKNCDQIISSEKNNFRKLLQTFGAGSIVQDTCGQAECRYCNLKQSETKVLFNELTKMGSVERYW